MMGWDVGAAWVQSKSYKGGTNEWKQLIKTQSPTLLEDSFVSLEQVEIHTVVSLEYAVRILVYSI